MANQKFSIKPKFSSRITYKVLNKWNIALAVLFAVQAGVILAISNGTSLPVTTGYLTKDSLASQAAGQTVLAPAMRHLFDIRLSYIIAASLLIATVVHLLVASRMRKRYEADLRAGINRFRWFKYAASGGLALMMVAIVNGVYDVSTLLSIFAFTEILALFCVLIESVKDLKKHPRVSTKLPFLAGIMPWLVTAIYLFGAQIYGDPGLSTYVYILDGTIFALLLIKAAIMWLNGHAKNKWADYLYTERGYMMIDFVFLSALAWQIFFGTLR